MPQFGENDMGKEIDQLLEEYGKIYQTRTRDFNALSTIHLSENDHTNILCEILNMKVMDKKPFMKSFVNDVLGIINYDNLIAKTQVSALGAATKVTKKDKEGRGFIDLLLEDKKQNLYIIIENKVCGAGDGQNQLARYYFTYKKDDTNLRTYYKDYLDTWNADQADVNNSVYLVYLTDYTYEDKQDEQDAKEKCPSETSINSQLRENLRDIYRHISYEEHIYSWLKEQVLPMIPYGKNGDAHHSVILYLRELENILGANNSKNEWYISQQEKVANILEKVFSSRQKDANNDDDLYKYWNEIYNKIDSSLKDDAYKDNGVLADLRDCILCYRDSIYGKYAPEGWTVYCAANYITFYPTRWLAKFGGSKTSCVHFAIDNWYKGNYMIMLKIHGSACKQYIVKDENTFNTKKQELDNLKLVIPQDCNSFEYALTKFQKSNHYYFNLEINLKQMEPSLEWKRDSQASDNFFSRFIENDTIKQLVKYIDDNFK